MFGIVQSGLVVGVVVELVVEVLGADGLLGFDELVGSVGLVGFVELVIVVGLLGVLEFVEEFVVVDPEFVFDGLVEEVLVEEFSLVDV
jgi:hypothetical protein